MSNNFLLHDRYVRAVSNSTTGGSELVKQSADLTYPKIKTLTAGDGVVLVNTDNSVEISTVSSKDGILRGTQTLTYAAVVVSVPVEGAELSLPDGITFAAPEVGSSFEPEETLIFNTVVGELANDYDTGTGVFTVPRTGNYLVSFSSRYALKGDINIEVRVGNTVKGTYTRTNDGGTSGIFIDFSFSLPFEFNKSDKVSFVIKVDTSVNTQGQANNATKQMEFSIVSLG
jgi:hypothetical protein